MFKRFLLIFFLAITGLTCTFVLGSFLAGYSHSATSISKVLTTNKAQFTIIRYSFIALFLLFWPFFISFIGKKYHWDKQYIKKVKRFWIYFAGFFVFFEIFIINNLLGRLF